MAKSWKCEICGEHVSEIGAFAKLALNKYAHLHCHNAKISELVVDKYLKDRAQEQADRARVEADRAAEAEEAARAALRALLAKGKDLWTRDDRIKLVAAKMICVHCAKPLPPRGGFGGEGKHCRDCYFASQYGEQQAAQGAAKSAEGIATVAAVLANGAKEPAKPEAPKKAEETDRFGVIEID